MSDARLSDYVNLKDALRSFSQESRAIMLDDEDVARLFGRALAQIESLQREKAALLNFIDSHGIDREEVDAFFEGNRVNTGGAEGE